MPVCASIIRIRGNAGSTWFTGSVPRELNEIPDFLINTVGTSVAGNEELGTRGVPSWERRNNAAIMYAPVSSRRIDDHHQVQTIAGWWAYAASKSRTFCALWIHQGQISQPPKRARWDPPRTKAMIYARAFEEFFLSSPLWIVVVVITLRNEWHAQGNDSDGVNTLYRLIARKLYILSSPLTINFEGMMKINWLEQSNVFFISVWLLYQAGGSG